MLAKLIKLILALAIISLGAYTLYLWWPDLLVIIRGSIGLGLVLVGLLVLALATD